MLVNQTHDAACANRTGIRRDTAVGDRCERGFARTILPDERVNLTGHAIEVDAVDGGKCAVSFANPAEFEC